MDRNTNRTHTGVDAHTVAAARIVWTATATAIELAGGRGVVASRVGVLVDV